MPGNQICTQPHYRKNVTSWNPSQKMLPLVLSKKNKKSLFSVQYFQQSINFQIGSETWSIQKAGKERDQGSEHFFTMKTPKRIAPKQSGMMK